MLLNGQAINPSGPAGPPITGSPASSASQCLTDTFSVSGRSGHNPPIICGENSNQHSKQRLEKKFMKFNMFDLSAVYVDIDGGCTDLVFQFLSGTSSRKWNIKVLKFGSL